MAELKPTQALDLWRDVLIETVRSAGPDRLGMLGLARRRRDDQDRRSVLVQRTVKGSVFLSDFAESVSAASRRLEQQRNTLIPYEQSIAL
jgi:hypothetical protein